jgi:hypothetical protein
MSSDWPTTDREYANLHASAKPKIAPVVEIGKCKPKPKPRPRPGKDLPPMQEQPR